MNSLNRLKSISPLALALFVLGSTAACAPMYSRPTLNEVRLGQARSDAAADPRLEPGEIRGEIAEIDPSRREIRVITDTGRRDVLPYDAARTRVVYHGREYVVENLQAGDVIAYRPPARSSDFVDIVRVYEPVQARAATRLPARAAKSVVEGTVERVNYDLGVFDVRTPGGKVVTVSVPYNARAADVDDFKRLRRGDSIRVEGEFVNADNVQLLAILSPRGR
jgi:hypothetical protein